MREKILKECSQRQYFLWIPKSFGNIDILTAFYCKFIWNVIHYFFTHWDRSLCTEPQLTAESFQSLLKNQTLWCLTTLCHQQTLRTGQRISRVSSYNLSFESEWLPSGHRLYSTACKIQRRNWTFVPGVMQLLNAGFFSTVLHINTPQYILPILFNLFTNNYLFIINSLLLVTVNLATFWHWAASCTF